MDSSKIKWIVEGPQLDNGKNQMDCSETIWTMVGPKWIMVVPRIVTRPKWTMVGPCIDYGST